MVVETKLSKEGSPPMPNPTPYIRLWGLFNMPPLQDQTFVCVMSNPLEAHWTTVERILRCLKGTTSWGLHLRPIYTSLVALHAYRDVEWGYDPDDKCRKE